MRNNFTSLRGIMPIVSLLTMVSCGSNPSQNTVATAPEYNVVQLSSGDATVYVDFAAEVKSGDVVEIRPRVSGYVDKIFVDEGSQVAKGKPIFKINEDDFREQLNAAKASVDRAIANVDKANLEVQKLKPLVAKNIISHYELQTAESSLKAANAELAQAKSQYENAKIDLGYTTITSPVNGVVGRIIIRPGSLVSSSGQEALTTVSGSGNVYAYFSLDEKKLLTVTRDAPGKDLKDKLAYIPEVQFILADGTIYPHKGRIEAASGLIDAQTGSIQLKASYPNPDMMIRTGSSGIVRLPVDFNNVIMVPQKATYELQDKVMVYLVDPATSLVKSQLITVESISGNNFVISSGLSSGDQIVYEGIDKLRDNMAITPKLVSAEKAPAIQ